MGSRKIKPASTPSVQERLDRALAKWSELNQMRDLLELMIEGADSLQDELERELDEIKKEMDDAGV